MNVGREILQRSKMLNVISKRLVRKSLDMFKDISKDKEKYKTFCEFPPCFDVTSYDVEVRRHRALARAQPFQSAAYFLGFSLLSGFSADRMP